LLLTSFFDLAKSFFEDGFWLLPEGFDALKLE
jgi:hypothetical protein